MKKAEENKKSKIIYKSIYPCCPYCRNVLLVLDECYQCADCKKKFDRISGEEK